MKMTELTSLMEKWMNASKAASAATSVDFNGERALALLPKEVKGPEAELLKPLGLQALPLLMENVLVQARVMKHKQYNNHDVECSASR